MEENNFIKLDKPGRDKFKTFLTQFNYTFEDTPPKCGVDIIFKDNKGNKYPVELKNRSTTTDKFSTLYIEDGKYNTLLRWANKPEYKTAFYINFVGPKMYIYSVPKLEYLISTIGWDIKVMNAVTALSNHKIPKKVCELPKSVAIQYIYTDSKWKKIS